MSTFDYGYGMAERFARETTQHQMTVLHDDGLYRHLRFTQPRNEIGWFDLITVPGALIFQGDGETFAFRRVKDMFEFFRGPVGRINPGYWAEKLTTDHDSVMRYSEALFKQAVAEELAETEEAWPGVTDAWNELFDGPFPGYSSDDERAARDALDGFEFGASFSASCSCGASQELPGGGVRGRPVAQRSHHNGERPARSPLHG